MTATDELRRLLDERGVEWREGLGNEHRVETFFDDMNGHTALFVDFGDGNPFGSESELSADLTPAQAVEATLGNGLAAENAKLRELCGELYHELYAAIDEYWPASYLGDLEPRDVFPRYDELIELGVDA